MFVIIVLSVILVIVLITVFVALSATGEKLSELDNSDWQQRWQQINNYLSSNNPTEWKMAVIEADKFLDALLKFKGLGGNGLGERLKVAQAKWPQLRTVWWVHKLRNQLVHEPDKKLTKSQAVTAVKEFKQAARLLGFRK